MNKVFGVLVGAVAMTAVSVVVTTVNAVRVNRTINRLNRCTRKVEDMSDDRISEIMLKNAVDKATDAKIERYLKNVKNETMEEASRKLKEASRSAVEAAAYPIREEAAEKIAQQVADLDIEQLKRRVSDKAEERVINKLDNVIETSAKKFNDQLDQTKKIYDKLIKATAEKERDDTYHVVLI